MKKILLLIILILSTAIQAADTELQDLAELVAITGTDILYVVDDPAGAPLSRKIPALGLFDLIDTSAELLAILTDETGTGFLCFATSPTLVTPILGTITSGVGTALTALNGENIQDDTIDDDSIDFADVTFADFDFETAWKMWHSDAAGDVIEITLGADGTFLESNGAAANPAFRVLADADVPDTITINLATLATTVTLADDDATNDNQDIVFTTDAAGPVNLEADIGDFYYNPSTGTVTATEYVGGGAGITGLSVLYNNIGDPGASGSISFDNAETATYTSANDSAVSFFNIVNSDADHTGGNMYLLNLDYSGDDDDVDADYFQCQDSGGVVFSIQQNGDTASTGNIEGATLTEGGVAVYNDDEIDSFAEIDAIVVDKSLVNLEDGGTFTGNVIANGNLSVGNADTTAGVLTLLEDDDDGAHFASFMVPALAANTVYTLPPDDGDNTEVLQTNGTGTLTWVANAGGGVTALNDIGDATGAGTVVSGANEHLWTWENDAANEVFMNFSSIDADTDNNQWILELSTYDDGDANLFFMRCRDDVDTTPNTVFEIAADGATSMDGGLTVGGSITEGGVAVPNVDETDWVAAAEMADADHGDVQWAAGVAYVQAATLVDTVYASCYVGLYQAATGNNEPFYTDAGLTYDATSGTLSSTVLTEGGNAVYNSTEVPGGSLGGTWATPTIDDLFILLGGDVATAGDYDFGSANVDLELPQASPAVPDVDGQIELDFTDGTVVIQHGSAHAELGAATDVVVGKLIRSFGATIFAPDGVNDVMTVKAINSIEFPHGIVITAVYLGVSSDDGYVLTVQNFDDFDTINGANPTIDTVTYSADTTGEIIDTTPTYATIGAGQIIMVSIPATDVDWIHFEIYYYEPAA